MKIRSFASRAFVWLPRASARRRRIASAPWCVRTVERVRYVPVYTTSTCGGCAPAVAPAPQPIVYQTAYTTCGGCAPTVAAPVYYAPRYDYAPRYYGRLRLRVLSRLCPAILLGGADSAVLARARLLSLKQSQRPVAVRRIEIPDPPSNPSTL